MTYRLLGSARRIEKVEAPPQYFYWQGGPVSIMAACDYRYGDLVDALRENCRFFREAGSFAAMEPYLLRMALRHLIFGRFGDFLLRGGREVTWPYLDRAYRLLDSEFPDWRHSAVLRAMCNTRYSFVLVRSKLLMKLFVIRPNSAPRC